MRVTKEQLFATIKHSVKKWVGVLLNPRLLLCLFIAWMITNGWCYIFAAVGTACGISWMTITGGAYMGLLWLPFTPEKVVTLLIAIFLMKKLFPNDKKTLGVLHSDFQKFKSAVRKKRDQHKDKRKVNNQQTKPTD